MRAHIRRTGAAILAAAVAAMAIAACGGDDETGSPTAVGASGASGAVGAVVTAGSLVTCLQAAGYGAATTDPVLGLDAEHTQVELPLGDLDQGAAFVVFPDEASAKAADKDASALVGVSPTELTGNVVWGFDAAADESPDDQQAVEACLPV